MSHRNWSHLASLSSDLGEDSPLRHLGEPATRDRIVASIRSHGPGATLEFEREKQDGSSDTVFVTIERTSGIESLAVKTIGTGAAALAGLERIKSAYSHAIAAHYRFFSYGDACLIERPED